MAEAAPIGFVLGTKPASSLEFYVLPVLDELNKYAPCESPDDASHERKDRQERDAFVDRVLAKAGLPLLHIRAQAAYDPKQLAVSIGEAIRR